MRITYSFFLPLCSVIAAMGQAFTQIPQSMHFCGSCSITVSRSLFAITGHTPVHELQ